MTPLMPSPLHTARRENRDDLEEHIHHLIALLRQMYPANATGEEDEAIGCVPSLNRPLLKEFQRQMTKLGLSCQASVGIIADDVWEIRFLLSDISGHSFVVRV